MNGEQQAKQTPLVELLDAVPADIRIGVQDGEEWHAGTTWHPVGHLCQEAAAELRRLHAVNEMLLEALKDAARCVQDNYQPDECGYDWDDVIAKAEGQA
jgi:hypothetical protein